MNVGSMVNVEYRGEIVRRKIIRVSQCDMEQTYWLEGIWDRSFTIRDFI